MAQMRTLYRSVSQNVVGGVAAGIGERFNVSAKLVRLAFIVLTFCGGSGILFYAILWMITPKQPDILIIDGVEEPSDDDRSWLGDLIRGGLLTLPFALAASFIADDSIVFPFALGLGIGLYFFWRSSDLREKIFVDRMGLYRVKEGKKVFGVFGGLADRFGIDPTILRLVGVALVIFGSGAIIPIYLLYAWLVPMRERSLSANDPVIIV